MDLSTHGAAAHLDMYMPSCHRARSALEDAYLEKGFRDLGFWIRIVKGGKADESCAPERVATPATAKFSG